MTRANSQCSHQEGVTAKHTFPKDLGGRGTRERGKKSTTGGYPLKEFDRKGGQTISDLIPNKN